MAVFKPMFLCVRGRLIVGGSIAAMATAASLTAPPALAENFNLSFLTFSPPGMPAGDTAGAADINNIGQILVNAQPPSGPAIVDNSYIYNTITHNYTALPSDSAAIPERRSSAR